MPCNNSIQVETIIVPAISYTYITKFHKRNNIRKGAGTMTKFTVKELMTHFGFLMEESDLGIRLSDPNEQNILHFHQVLDQLKGLSFTDEMEESTFIGVLEEFFESTGEMLYPFDQLELHTVDIYIRGLVMQLNRLGCATTGSCDGHDRNRAHIYFVNSHAAKKAAILLDRFNAPCHLNRTHITFTESRYELPQLASQLAGLTVEDAEGIFNQNNPLMKQFEYFTLLEQLLSINGPSGEEDNIRTFVIKQLTPYVDYLEVDHYGNVLAQVKKGNGPTVLLNAHLDTVDNFAPDRTILKDNHIWTASEGILGADDRAGVCVILAVAQTLQNSTFRGTMKFAFTVEEEIGLVGARQLAKSFLWGVDMAFVVDRRGIGDIVTSCGGYISFCTDEFARNVKRIGHHVHRNRWNIVAGGSSDTRIWAEQGINSINLSAGYNYEHTSNEILDIKANYGTYEFVTQLLEESRYLKQVIRNRNDRNRIRTVNRGNIG
ncbi:M20/M25/M40 family metallo-hydrolase [Lysinibacillus antri]|uniref:M20/M25/M40 family metallo-hydrolase n=2 Tax=Lysinibacillus antri TaxID=2498145 RepID=A0A3S0QP05_9BACI|nr:M20/M25/M40 family metallo-hydrolase [Lysinibacillus antri]